MIFRYISGRDSWHHLPAGFECCDEIASLGTVMATAGASAGPVPTAAAAPEARTLHDNPVFWQEKVTAADAVISIARD